MIQVIKCSCGSVFAACKEPHCYEEKEWMDNLRKYVKKGCTVNVVDSFKFDPCTCDKIKNQMSLQL